MDNLNAKLRQIPAIDRLVAEAAGQSDLAALPGDLLTGLLRRAAEALRVDLRSGRDPEISAAAIIDRARAGLAAVVQPSLRRVVNATGVVLHTNLGRAPLSSRARERVNDILDGYSTLEYDVTVGRRGTRHGHVAGRIAALTGAEAALVVNNNAAAVLLTLAALARGREVIVSRGQLVEIGGSFRIPDVMAQSGAILVEVGTTNRTRLRDYEQVIGPETAAILKVHTSNYRIVGFTAQPDDADLVALARKHRVAVVEDLGSGTVLPVSAGGWREPPVAERIAAGMDLVTFSGDKLFGGAQAGIIAGRAEYIDILSHHPLLRAVRVDKLTLAALEGTLLDYTAGRPQQDIPVQRMLNTPDEVLAERAAALAGLLAPLPGWTVDVQPSLSQAGGGSLPAVDLPGWCVRVRSDALNAAAAEARLRRRQVPVIVRVNDDSIILDVRCLSDRDLAEIRQAFAEIEGSAL